MKYTINDLRNALEILNIPESASLSEIKKIYKELLFQWHPDRCKEKKELCNQKTREINKSYKIMRAYCENYKFKFNIDEMERNHGDNKAANFWYERFGDDPIWS